MTHSFIRSFAMVVKTRSRYSTNKAQESDGRHSASLSDESIIITAPVGVDGNTSRGGGGGRRVQIITPSFREASLRTYKLYTPRHNKKKAYEAEAAQAAAQAAAEALVLLQEQEQESGEEGADSIEQHSSEEADLDTSTSTTADSSFVKHTCINPLNPVTQYIYRICVYDIDRTTHLKSAYILYNPKNRLYYVYSIISNQNACYDSSIDEEPMAAAASASASSGAVATLPEPMNTLQLKFSTYIVDTIIHYIMTLIVPSRDYNYYIQDDIIGVVSSNNHGDNDFEKTAFDDESTFYDIDSILYDTSSTLTTNGFKAFMITPSRQFWYNYSPTYVTNTATVIENNRFPSLALDPIMLILSQSR